MRSRGTKLEIYYSAGHKNHADENLDAARAIFTTHPEVLRKQTSMPLHGSHTTVRDLVSSDERTLGVIGVSA